MIAILGCLLGILTGLIPGLGLFTGLLLVYPWLITLSIQDLIIFYISMAAASQYTGSISAMLLQIPGEANSIFALKESKFLIKENKLGAALGASALGSLAGGLGALLITIFLLLSLENIIPYFFRSDIKTIVLIFSAIAFVLFAENKLYVSLGFGILGFLLSIIGISPFGAERTFGFDILLFGIPWYSLILGVWILPQIWMQEIKVQEYETKPSFYWNTGVVTRSIIVGYIGGLIPGISYIIGTKMAWLLENKISGNSLKRLLAAETANNASAYSMIVPLLILSVPIVSSEALILDIANAKGFQFNWDNVIKSGWFSSTITPVVIINLIMTFVSIFFIKYLTLWAKIPKLKMLLTCLLLFSLYLSSVNLYLDFYVFVISLFFGVLWKSYDVSPLPLMLLIGDQIEQNMTRFIIIYS